MSAPTYPLPTQPSPGLKGSTLALTITPDPDNPVAGDLHMQGRQYHYWSGTLAARQKQQTRLNMFLGEWFININEGIPYYQSVFVKNPSNPVILSIFRKALLLDPQVLRVNTISLEVDGATREAQLFYDVTLKSGERITSADYGPFILNGVNPA